jgi:hypothetical protein
MTNDIEGGADEIRNLIASNPYRKLAEAIISAAGKRLCADVYDAEISHCMKLCAASGLTTIDISRLVSAEETELKAFCVAYIAAEEKLSLGQEYNPLEPPEDLEPPVEIYNCHSQVFLFDYGIYFLMLRDKPGQLASFLKATRVPHAAKYGKLLIKFFAEFRASR